MQYDFFESEITRNPFIVRIWLAYILDIPNDAIQLKFSIYERSLTYLPLSFKIWWKYLNELVQFYNNNLEQYEFVNEVFEKCLIYLNKMPMIWLLYTEFLEKQKKITKTRRVYNRSLMCLAITQHLLIWHKYINFAINCKSIKTAQIIFQRYIQLCPESSEEYYNYLLSIEYYDEAALLLSKLINDENFVSKFNKTRHDLYLELCKLISCHPDAINSINVEEIIRNGIKKFPNDISMLWNALAKKFTLSGKLSQARDIYEEGINSIGTIEDFAIIYDAYLTFMEYIIQNKVKKIKEIDKNSNEYDDLQDELEFLFSRLENLIKRRKELISSVKLRQNVNNVYEWLNRAKIYENDSTRVIMTFSEAIKSINPHLCVGKYSFLWIKFARFYEENGDLISADEVMQKATESDQKNLEEMSSLWCEWTEIYLRNQNYKKALDIIRNAIHKKKSEHQFKLFRSVKIWSLLVDLEENFGSFETTRATYEKMFTLKVITPLMVLNYANLLSENKYFEDSFKVYEKGISVFKWPEVECIWLTYLAKFVSLFKHTKLERTRELFYEVLKDVPATNSLKFYIMYAKLEEQYGLTRHELSAYKRAILAVPEEDLYEVYLIYIIKVIQYKGVLKSRDIFMEAIGKLHNDKNIRNICLKFAHIEKSLGETSRARGIYEHASQFCSPTEDKEFWDIWRDFEVSYGNEDTFRSMLRIKRSIENQIMHINMAT